MTLSVPASVLAAWPGLSVEPLPFGTGLINLTLKGTLGAREIVLQRVHPVFADSVHDDIEAVTAHLERKGMLTPRLVRTSAGALSVLDDERRPWRVLTFVRGGHSHDRLATPEDVAEAGRLVGRFHAALADLEHRYVHVRPGVHDLPFRARALEAALDAHGDHVLHARVAAPARDVLALMPRLLRLDVSRARNAHGDLKASNLLFDERGRGLALVDLDTVASMPLPFELGDALRSWCNPSGEDATSVTFDAAAFEAALRGYAEGSRGLELAREEVDAVAAGALTITAELAMRFLTDALEERYFGWDPRRFATRGEHNLVRAEGQLALARSVLAQLAALEACSRRLLGR